MSSPSIPVIRSVMIMIQDWGITISAGKGTYPSSKSMNSPLLIPDRTGNAMFPVQSVILRCRFTNESIEENNRSNLFLFAFPCRKSIRLLFSKALS